VLDHHGDPLPGPQVGIAGRVYQHLQQVGPMQPVCVHRPVGAALAGVVVAEPASTTGPSGLARFGSPRAVVAPEVHGLRRG
jgi:hypothetical protein